MKNTSNQHAVRALTGSIITPGVYVPRLEFLALTSIAITLDDKPIVIVGPENDQESIEIVDRLLASEEFAALVTYEFGDYKKISKAVISNEIFTGGDEYNALVKKNQDAEVEDGEGKLVSLIPLGSKAFGFGLCVSNELMLCFYPHAIPLTEDITLLG